MGHQARAHVRYAVRLFKEISLWDLAVNAQAAFSSGGWVEVDSVNNPGLYRFDCPDAAFIYEAGVTKVEVTITATGAHAETKEIELVPPVITQGIIGAALDSQPTYNQYTFTDGTVRKDYK